MSQALQNPRRCIRRPEVVDKTGLSASQIMLMEKKGDFPKHFMLSPRCAVWDELDIDQWIEARKSGGIKPISLPKGAPLSVPKGSSQPLRRTALAKRRAKEREAV